VKKKNINPMLLGAIALGLVSFYLVYKAFQNQQADSERKTNEAIAKAMASQGSNQPVILEKKPERPVVYAAQPIAAGQKIEVAGLKIQSTPTELLPGALSTFDEAVGKYASKSIGVGEALTANNVSTQAQRMSMRLKPGMRAMALPVFNTPETNSTGGFAMDGDYVDLLLTFNDAGVSRTIIVLQNLRILYNPVGQRSEQTDGIAPAAAPGSPPMVTFEVTPQQAEMLVQITGTGAFHMVLRSSEDKAVVRTRGYSSQEFFDNPRAVQTRALKSQLGVDEALRQLREKEAKDKQDKQDMQNKEKDNANANTPKSP
jgi:Flp pilus assembly protein CpaB